MEKSTLRQRARDLRKNGTDAERHLWYHLRDRDALSVLEAIFLNETTSHRQ